MENQTKVSKVSAAFRAAYPERNASQIRSTPQSLPVRRLARRDLDKGAFVDLEGVIASRRCPTCLHYCTEEEFFAGKALLAQISKRGELRDVLVHKTHLPALRQVAYVHRLRETAEPIELPKTIVSNSAARFIGLRIHR